MMMHNPPHPGEVLKKLCLEALGVSRKTLSSILI
jgi:plasmid maintenance system antidote protein VapI